jgi:hypothetical protein
MSHSFLSSETFSTTVAEGTVITTIDLCALFHNQKKTDSFLLGNTSSGLLSFDITASGANTALCDTVLFWQEQDIPSGTITLTLAGGEISDPVYFSVTPVGPNTTLSGSFLVHVEES